MAGLVPGVAKIWPATTSLSLLVPFLLAGAWLVAQGAYRLFDYLRTNPYPRTAEGVKA